MVDKKIKLPDSLSIDKVSPATRLLEKRRLMYEIQKAFENQKREFEEEEKKCRVREKELREKDILIQDNLIRFSSFLQQQDTRKRRDQQAAQDEKNKIEEKKRDIEQANAELERQQAFADLVNKKLEKLKKYEDFLKEVLAANSSEFKEIGMILMRHQTLSEANVRMTAIRTAMEEQLDQTIQDMEQY